MKHLLLVTLVFLLSVTSSDAQIDRSERQQACRLVQREVQDAVPIVGRRLRERIRAIRTAARVVRGALSDGEVRRGCAACILRQVVRGTAAAEQRPCGRHDVCVAGSRLSPGVDECVDRVCERDRRCCQRWWGRRCVAAVEDLCERSCEVCSHSECIVGEALPRDCSECTRQVCAADPYCCDAAWDLRCVDEARTVCEDGCQLTSTTLVTSTTIPICRGDEDCHDADPCTVDACDREHGCVFEPYACDDGNACTLDSCDGEGGCLHELVVCDDDDLCTLDFCDAAGDCRHSRIGCSDGDACTVDDCEPAVGCVYEPVDCTDDDECTADTCDPVLGCVSEIDPSECRIGVRYGRP